MSIVVKTKDWQRLQPCSILQGRLTKEKPKQHRQRSEESNNIVRYINQPKIVGTKIKNESNEVIEQTR